MKHTRNALILQIAPCKIRNNDVYCPFSSWKPCLECGVVGHVMQCDREIHTKASMTFDATIHSEKYTCLTIIVLFGKWLCQFWRVYKIGVRVIATPSFTRCLCRDSNWKEMSIPSSRMFLRCTIKHPLLPKTIQLSVVISTPNSPV
jgi:hypothetical protein